jgi:GR25 family glycosyltransferase involved in LPS biosynthesis
MFYIYMKYFWINLDSAEKRKAEQIKEFEENHIEHYRVSAFGPIDAFNINKGTLESACSRSHILAIFSFLMHSRDEYAIICEDDLRFEYKPFWGENTVETVFENAPKDCGALQLACILQFIEKKFPDKDLYFNYNELATSSTLAYVIKRKCAEELVSYHLKNSTKPLPRADDFQSGLFQAINKHTNFTSYTYKYPMFTYGDDIGVNDSQIINDNGHRGLHSASKRGITHYLRQHKKQLEQKQELEQKQKQELEQKQEQ